MAKSLKDMVGEAKQQIDMLSVAEVEERLAEQDEKPMVLDVREPKEYQQGHLPEAILLPRGLLEIRADAEHPMRDERLEDRQRPVITYCTGGIGARSAMAAQTLKEMGFANVSCLEGGLDAWSEAGKPVETTS
jgi:rhodanese-related sulfurtransferase